ncbi:Ger(x)C family spore germination protein [Gorillibacterium sp. sgz5001074]|uniref:Ger(x)C family spore germination protein n=1 Tax=Gorillibacterium sp. sgz5001074 TaxID=3446695 RepID=UPI003F671A5A
MKNLHRTVKLLGAGAVGAVLLTGCWDRREINDVAIVTGTAMDKVGGKYRAAVQFPLPGQLGGPGGGGGGTSGSKASYVDSATGETVRDANGQLQRSLSRQLYFAHRRVLVIGEELAKSGIAPVLDVTVRTAQNRMSAFVVFAKGEAIDLLNADAVMEKLPSEMLRELTVNAMKSPRTLRNVVDTLLSDGLDLAVPYYISEKNRVGEKGQPKTTITQEGIAVFQGDKLTGLMKGEAAKGVLWAMNQAKRPSVTVAVPKGEGNITVQFSENQVDLKPSVQGDEVSMEVRIRAVGNIFENTSTFKSSSDNLVTVRGLASDKVRSEVEKGVKQLQEYGSDACGFGDTIFREKPGEWKRLKERWRELYPQVKVSVHVELQIEHSGNLLEPAARKRENLVQ